MIGDKENTINYLIENKKIDFSMRDHNQNTCLHLALQIKYFNVFKLILDFIMESDCNEDTKKINFLRYE